MRRQPDKDITKSVTYRLMVTGGVLMAVATCSTAFIGTVGENVVMVVSGMALAGAVLGAAGLLAHAGAWARRRALRRAQPAASKQLDAPATASVPGATVRVPALNPQQRASSARRGVCPTW